MKTVKKSLGTPCEKSHMIQLRLFREEVEYLLKILPDTQTTDVWITDNVKLEEFKEFLQKALDE